MGVACVLSPLMADDSVTSFLRIARTSSVAADFDHPVTGGSEILVPSLRETCDDVFNGAAGNLDARMNDISPGVNASALVRMLFKANPLREYDS